MNTAARVSGNPAGMSTLGGTRAPANRPVMDANTLSPNTPAGSKSMGPAPVQTPTSNMGQQFTLPRAQMAVVGAPTDLRDNFGQ
jgi:hypothetical protein